MREFRISEKTESLKLFRFLQKVLESAPSSFIYKMLRKKNIVLNDKKADGSEVLCSGDVVKIYLSDETFEKFSQSRKDHNSDKRAHFYRTAEAQRSKASDMHGSLEKNGPERKSPENNSSEKCISEMCNSERPSSTGKKKFPAENKRENKNRNKDKSKRKNRNQSLPGWFVSHIIFEDDDIIVINKPAGVLSQKADNREMSLAEYINIYLEEKEKAIYSGTEGYTGSGNFCDESFDFFRTGTANRLDRNTSGLVFAGKTVKGMHFLNDCFRNRDLQKIYTVLVAGNLEKTISEEAWLKKDKKKNKALVSDRKSEGAVRISTDFVPVSHGSYKGIGFTLVKAQLHTGKPHQIRAHLKKLGFSVAGDTKYGSEKVNKILRNDFSLKSQFLHAGTVVFGSTPEIPEKYRKFRFSAPLPENFSVIIKEIGL